tara:strand:+ start:54 stop:215 length:162 start_codon:yes stop_codon:yes gene_type:complete
MILKILLMQKADEECRSSTSVFLAGDSGDLLLFLSFELSDLLLMLLMDLAREE